MNQDDQDKIHKLAAAKTSIVAAAIHLCTTYKSESEPIQSNFLKLETAVSEYFIALAEVFKK